MVVSKYGDRFAGTKSGEQIQIRQFRIVFVFDNKNCVWYEKFLIGIVRPSSLKNAENVSCISTKTFYYEGEGKLPGLLAERLLSPRAHSGVTVRHVLPYCSRLHRRSE